MENQNSSSTPLGSSQSPIGIDDSSTPTTNSSPLETSFPINNEEIIVESSHAKVIEGAENVGDKRKRSDVWNHFTKCKDEAKAQCNYCHKKLCARSTDGTSHLRDHIKSCLKRTCRDIRQHVLVKEQNKADGKVTLSNYNFDQDVSRKDLATMIILHEYPLSMVEHHGFRIYSKNLQPLFKVPSRNTVKSDILKIYDYEKKKTLDFMEKVRGRVAVTTDMWTATNQKKGFMAITAHFIDNQWNMQSRIIRFVYVPCPHTAEVLSEVLLDCMLEWNLDRKVSTLTVDNCNTNDSIINNLLRKLNTSSLLLDGKLFHMRCCAHILNLIVQDGLSVIGDGIERVRDSVAFWTASPKREQTFEEFARQMHVPCTKKLALDCKTRWNSTYLMLSVALVYKDVFSRLTLKESQYKCKPTETDWAIAREVCERLKLFYDVTEMFSGTKYPTLNIFFPHICEIRFALNEWLTCSNLLIRDMASNMLFKFDKYWNVIHGIMGVAAVLDPRYKLKLLQFFFPKLYGEKANDEIKCIRELCYELLDEYQSRMKKKELHKPSESSSSLSTSQGFLSGYDLFVTDTDDLPVKSELDQYLEEKVLPRTEEFEILAWWKSNGPKYPTLQRIARDILAIPISTVASKSAFSTGGRLVTPHRSRLHPNTLEALMCAQSWLWSETKGTCSEEMNAYCRSLDYDYDTEEQSTMSSVSTTM